MLLQIYTFFSLSVFFSSEEENKQTKRDRNIYEFSYNEFHILINYVLFSRGSDYDKVCCFAAGCICSQYKSLHFARWA